jgi:4-hydroxymandelate oxidase
MSLTGAACLADFETAAVAVLPADAWDYIAGGSDDERAVSANTAALRAVQMVPRALRDVSRRATTTTFFGRTASLPLAVAPMAYQALAHRDGELATARGAASAGVPFVVPMLSSVPIETIATSGADLWVQLYWLRDRGVTAELIERAVSAGCRAVVLTVDMPVMARRPRDLRNGLALPPSIRAVHLRSTGGAAGQPERASPSTVAADIDAAFDPSLSWQDLEWIRARTSLPLVLKGILHPDDARQAAQLGVEAIVVSNHGGRQLSSAVTGVTVLPAVRAAVEDRCTVLLDGGVRGGVDVLASLALGADGVLVGRPALWGLATGGADGVSAVLRIIGAELDNAMALAGCRDLVEARQLRVGMPGEPIWGGR